jgi:hypothetical protein
MTIAASLPLNVSLRADLFSATAALARKAARRPQLNPASSIDNAALKRIYLLIPRRTIKQPASSTRRNCDRPTRQSKSP